MGANLATLSEIAIELYNGSSGGVALGTIDSEWLKSGEFNRLLILSDASLARAICQVKGLGARKTFLTGTQNGIANGAQLNAMVGSVESIVFVVTGGRWNGTHRAVQPRGATLDEQLKWIRFETQNVTSNPAIEPHYVQDGGTIFHNAAGVVLAGASAVSVNATFCQFTINFSASSAQCPDEYSKAIAVGALKMGMAKDGDRVDAAGYFGRLYSEELQTLGIPTMPLAEAA